MEAGTKAATAAGWTKSSGNRGAFSVLIPPKDRGFRPVRILLHATRSESRTSFAGRGASGDFDCDTPVLLRQRPLPRRVGSPPTADIHIDYPADSRFYLRLLKRDAIIREISLDGKVGDLV
jgi:hypothetical protein